MILRRGTQEMLRQWPQPLNPWTGLWRHSWRGYPELMNAVKSLEESLRNQDAIKTNLTAALTPGWNCILRKKTCQKGKSAVFSPVTWKGQPLNCVMAKKQYQRDTAEKIFENLVELFWLRGAGTPSNDALREKEATRRWDDRQISSQFGEGVKNDELRTMLATHYKPLSTNAPTPEELRLKSKEYLLLKPPSRSGYYKNKYGNFNTGPANQENNWYKPRDDMDKRRSCANCSSTDHHVSACPTYKQGMKAIGCSLEGQRCVRSQSWRFHERSNCKIRPEVFFFATWKVILNRIVRNSGML